MRTPSLLQTIVLVFAAKSGVATPVKALGLGRLQFRFWCMAQLGLIAVSAPLMADEKRVTVPLALPFQQALNANSAAAQSSVGPNYSVNANRFTQTPAPSPSAASSSLAAVVATAPAAKLAASAAAKPLAASQP
jgi:beta-lactamase class C